MGPQGEHDWLVRGAGAVSDLGRDELLALGVLANSVDRYDLVRAINRCDELVAQLRSIQLIHSENLCRLANRLAFGMDAK